MSASDKPSEINAPAPKRFRIVLDAVEASSDGAEPCIDCISFSVNFAFESARVMAARSPTAFLPYFISLP